MSVWRVFWNQLTGIWYHIPFPINMIVLIYFVPAYWIKYLLRIL